MSYLICSVALVVLIVIMPQFYTITATNIKTMGTKSELQEIADYTSNTIANLYFLTNSTNDVNAQVTKELIYLPLVIQDSFYTLSIVSVDGEASKITAALSDNPSISADSWLVPGLKVGYPYSVEVSSKSTVAGCYRNGTVWLGVEQ